MCSTFSRKNGFIKFIKPQNFRTDLDHVFVVDGATHRTAGTFLLFLFTAAVPVFLNISIFYTFVCAYSSERSTGI
jgi:hypothetical protein